MPVATSGGALSGGAAAIAQRSSNAPDRPFGKAESFLAVAFDGRKRGVIYRISAATLAVTRATLLRWELRGFPSHE